MRPKISSKFTPVKPAHDKDLRAGERVLQYLLAEFDRPDLKDGSRLPTNKELANRLQVSLGTVQAVMRQLAQDGSIRTLRGSGTFLVSDKQSASRPYKVGISYPLSRLQDPDGWISRIGGGMFQVALTGEAVLEGISDKGTGSEGIIAELSAKMSGFDALVVLPYTGISHDSLINRYEDAGKPVVHIHSPSLTSTAHFVSSDFFGASYDLGHAWRETRRRLLILTSVIDPCGMRTAVSYQQRQSGLLCGLGTNFWNHATLCIRTTGNNEGTIEAGYRAIKQYLSECDEAPDAVYCSGDWLALGAVQALQEARISVPDSVSVVGGSGLDLSHTECPNLTRVRHELERVGQQAIEMAIQRIKLKGTSLPGVVVPTSFIGGATTNSAENALLKIGPASLLRRFATSPGAEIASSIP